jgi:hypothetical protein
MDIEKKMEKQEFSLDLAISGIETLKLNPPKENPIRNVPENFSEMPVFSEYAFFVLDFAA